jgi:hypothetical protein
MKIIVDKMPTEPKECWFVGRKIDWHEEPRTGIAKYFLAPKTNPTVYYGCWLDRDFCELRKNGTCSKLKVINETD